MSATISSRTLRLMLVPVLASASAGLAQAPRRALMPNVPTGAFLDYATGARGDDAVPHPDSFQHIDAAGRVTTRPVSGLRTLLEDCRPGATSESVEMLRWSATCGPVSGGAPLLLTLTGTRSAVTGITVRRGADAVVIPPAPMSFQPTKKRK